MAAHGHRRQVLLFLLAIILPCVVLVVLGLRMVAQERELGEKRLSDQRRSVTGQIRQELSAQLDRIALQEATALLASSEHPSSQEHVNPAVVLIARATDGHLTLPWEGDPRSARFRRLLDQDEFAQLVSRGERTEIGSRSPEAAVDIYSEALSVARAPAQAAYARLLRGRSLTAAGRHQEALRDYEAVLSTDLAVIDEHGVPVALYAATRLLDTETQRQSVIERVQTALGALEWLSPSALYLLRDLVDSLPSQADSVAGEAIQDLEGAISARIACTEQAVALQRDFQRVGLTGAGGQRMHSTEPRWVPYGNPTWLVGKAAPLGGEADVVVAAWADSVFASVESAVLESSEVAAELALAALDPNNGELLGPQFPGLKVLFSAGPSASETGWDVRRWFYLVALLLVVSVTLFGAYLVSQDVRRELRLAEMRSRFVSAVSHELKTPLTAIRMFAETLQLGRSPDPADQEEYLETIVNESERLTRLLNNVLDFSKIERGKKEYRRTPNDLADIVNASARAMQYPLEQQHLTLNVDVQNGLPMVDVDRDAIEQAILNLLANAMKYSGDARVIDLKLERADSQAVITVVDRGFGVDPEEQLRIFEQFYRVPTKDNEGIPGTGLGLTLVRHIAEGHGGSVTVESTPGQGSTFAIRLPLEGGEI